MRWTRRGGALLLVLAAPIAACKAERRPTDTTSVSQPLDPAKPLAGLKPEGITIPQSPQFTAYDGLRMSLNEGATALDGGDRAKAGEALSRARSGYEGDFASPTRSTDPVLHDRILKSYDAMGGAVREGDGGTYRFNRYFADVGILRLATLRIRAALGKGEGAEGERWFSVIANRFDLAKDVQPVGAAWKRVQSGPVDATTQKAVDLTLGGYLGTKIRAELKGALAGLEEKNKAKARWEVAGGIAYFEAIKEVVQQQLGAEGARKLSETIQGVDAAIEQDEEARARSLIEQANAQLDAFDRSIAV
jgi:hypothetical protein